MTGAEIKSIIVAAGVKNYEVAEKYGITESSFSRKLRTGFNDEETKKVLSIVSELKKA